MEAQLQHTLIRDTHQFGGSKKSSMEEKAPPGIEKKKPPCECFIRLSQCCQSQHTHCTSGSPGSRCVPHTHSATTLLRSWVRSVGNSDVPCHTETPGAPWHPREKMLKRCSWEAAARNNNRGVQADHTQRPKHPSVVRGQVQYRGRGFASL